MLTHSFFLSRFHISWISADFFRLSSVYFHTRNRDKCNKFYRAWEGIKFSEEKSFMKTKKRLFIKLACEYLYGLNNAHR